MTNSHHNPPYIQADSATLHQLAQAIGESLQAHGQMLALAESCTGGLAASIITDLAGSSAWFQSGIVAYSNQAKQDYLQVSSDVLAQYGAVSEPVAKAMAQGLIQLGRCQIAASVTGIAGPSGGSVEKPVGTVCFAWADQHGYVHSAQHFLHGDRQQIRQQSVAILFSGIMQLLTTY